MINIFVNSLIFINNMNFQWSLNFTTGGRRSQDASEISTF